jgi:serine/threonine-protein kinase
MTTQALTIYDMVPGARIAERYRVVRPHRQGTMSSAFEAVDERDGERRELHLFPPGLFENDGQAVEFLASWKPWKGVDHPSVLRVRDALRVGPATVLLVTDHPSGPTLRAVLDERGRFGQEDAIRIGSQLLDGLEAIHAVGAVHGDVKPYTIHVEGKGADVRAVLVDGGITPGLWSAKHLGEKTALIGTPFYAPAEQFGGDAPDVQSDVYNVATVMFELVTGVLPWVGNNILEVFQAKLAADTPSVRQRAPDARVGAELEGAIRGGLAADRRKRFASAREFQDKLSACSALPS